MTGQVGYQKVVQVKTTGSTAYTDLPADSATLNLGRDLLEDTDFSTTGWRSRVAGLKDYSLNAPMFYGSTNSGVNIIRSAVLSGANLDFRYLPNGTEGFQGRVLCGNFSLSGDVGGLERVDVTLESDGTALTTV